MSSSMEASRPMLEACGLAKTFNPQSPNEVRALNGADLAADDGAWGVVIGTNGAGKSALLSAIAGTFLVDSGEIYVDGNDLTRRVEDERAKVMGRVFQNPFSGTAANMS